MRTEQRRQEVKARLQRAMLQLIRTQPFRDLRIESITAAAGLSRSAFYFYYRDKYELLQDVAEDATRALYEQADRWWHGSGDTEALIHDALGGAAEIYGRHRELLRLLTEVSTYEESFGQFWRVLIGRFIEATADYIRREQAAGRIDPRLDPDGTAELLVWGAERTMYVEVAVGGRDVHELSRQIAALWMTTFYGPDGGPRGGPAG